MSKFPRPQAQQNEFIARYRDWAKQSRSGTIHDNLNSFFSSANDTFSNQPIDILCPKHYAKNVIVVHTDPKIGGALMCAECCTTLPAHHDFRIINLHSCFGEHAVMALTERIAVKIREASNINEQPAFKELETLIESSFSNLIDFLISKKDELLQKLTRDIRAEIYSHITFEDLLNKRKSLFESLGSFRHNNYQPATEDHKQYCKEFGKLEDILSGLNIKKHNTIISKYEDHVIELEKLMSTLKREIEELAYLGLNKPERYQYQHPTEQRIKNLHKTNVYHLVLSPNEQFVLTSSDDPDIQTWDIPSGQRRLMIETREREGPKALAISENNQWITAGFYNTRVKVWSGVSGQFIFNFHYTRAIRHLATLNFVDNDKYIVATYNWDVPRRSDAVKIISNKRPTEFLSGRFNFEIMSSAYHQSQKYLAIGTERSSVEFLDINKLTVHHACKNILQGFPIWAINYSPKGRFLCVACTDYGLVLMDAQKGTVLRRLRENIHSFCMLTSGKSLLLAIGVSTGDVHVRGLWNLQKDVYRFKQVFGLEFFTNVLKYSKRNEAFLVGSDRDLKFIYLRKSNVPPKNENRHAGSIHDERINDPHYQEGVGSYDSDDDLDTALEYRDFSSQFFK